MDDKEKFEQVVDDAKNLLYLLEQLKDKNEINSSVSLLKYLNNVTISRWIVPYLDIKDIISFRSTCKEVNSAVSSTVTLVTYIKVINNKKLNTAANPNLSNILFKSFHEGGNDGEDVQAELESLKKIRDFLTQKLYQSEKIIKVYKNDLEYLKSELKNQDDITARLTDTLAQYREENSDAKRINMQLRQKLDDANKRNEDTITQHSKITEDLAKTIESLKNDKSALTNGVMKLKKIIEELKTKNSAKSEALKSIRNFFLTSTLFKLKNIAEFEDKDTISKNEQPAPNE